MFHDGRGALYRRTGNIYQSTVDAYKRIIPALKEKGYKFVTVSQMMQIAEIRGEQLPYLFRSAPEGTQAAASE